MHADYGHIPISKAQRQQRRRRQHLRCSRRAPIAEVEEILERRAKKVHDHDVVVTLDGEGTHGGNANAAAENLVQFGLIQQLRVLGLDRSSLIATSSPVEMCVPR